jgi:hypothetical protein
MSPRTCLAVAAFVALAACTSPREGCEADARRELDLIEALIAETELNIARGYRIEREAHVRNVIRLCLEPGARLPVCSGPEPGVRDRPVPIVRSEERARLETLKDRRRELLAPTEAAVAACTARQRTQR